MITSINEWRKINEAEQLKAFDTSLTDDDIYIFRNDIKSYFNSGLTIPAIKKLGVLDKLIISDYPDGVIIDYSAMEDGSKTGLLYSTVYKSLYPNQSLKSIGWQNHTIGTLKNIISVLFQKLYSFYKSINIDTESMKNSNKVIITLDTKETNEKTYYNSHGYTMKFSEFIELEVEDRDNYPMSDVEEWMTKYDITLDSECIWVTEDKEVAKSYKYEGDDNSVREIDSTLGFIIPETDDGDDGFLFVYN